MAKNPNDPSSTSMAYDVMAPTWAKINDVLGGTERMRAAGQNRAPMHEAETFQRYNDRIDGSTFFNASELTLDSWTGRPFSEPMQIEDVPEPLRTYLDDVDLQGNRINVFARNWFREGLAKAFAHVLVDNQTSAIEGPRTLRDDQEEGLRPYFTLVQPEDLIFASAEIRNGTEVLTHVRIKEVTVRRSGFTEEMVENIRVFDRKDEGVFVTIFTKVREKGKVKWQKGPSNKIDIDEIPLVTFYADRQGLMIGKSPLEDISDLNIRHWQSTSDQVNILTVARFPMLALSGGTEEESSIEIGPKKLLFTPDPNGKFYYVEHGGAAIEAGRKDLLDLEESMAHYGAQFTRRRPAIESATARVLNSDESTSQLRDAAIRFNDALANVLILLGKWVDLETVGSMKVWTDFSTTDSQAIDIQELGNARRNKDIARQDYLRELKNRNVLTEDFDIEGNEQRLSKEVAQEPKPEAAPMLGGAGGP